MARPGGGDDSKDGLTTLEGPRQDEIKGEGDFYSELHRAKSFSELRVKGEDKFNDLPVYVLQGVLKDGRKQECYFAKQTGLEAGYKEIAAPDTHPKTYYYDDYKEITGVKVKIPTKLRIVNSQMAMRMNVYDIVPNQQISDTVFAKPEKSVRDASGAGVPGRPDNGKVLDGVSANQFFGFRYTVPQGWTVHGEETQKAIMETGKEIVAGEDQDKRRIMEAASKRTFQLLTVFEYPLGTPNKTNRGVQVMAENFAFAPGIQTGKDYLQLMEKNLSVGQMHFEFEGEPIEETLDGIDFYHHYGHFQVGKDSARGFLCDHDEGLRLIRCLLWKQQGSRGRSRKVYSQHSAIACEFLEAVAAFWRARKRRCFFWPTLAPERGLLGSTIKLAYRVFYR
jgi:hypothetical protein